MIVYRNEMGNEISNLSWFLLNWLALVAWMYLVFFRGFFWKPDLSPWIGNEAPSHLPDVVAVVPARDEAGVIERTLSSLRRQDYPGGFSIILVDDNSEDRTSELARHVSAGQGHPLQVLAGTPPPRPWTGKLWALAQGIRFAGEKLPAAEYFWFTDADLEHDPATLRTLVGQAQAGKLALASNMARLHCTRVWERLLIPAFIFFFCKLYPFRFVNRPRHPMAAAAGGSMLVRRVLLERSGGIEGIRDELIDDCALARQLKPHGPIRLELTRHSRSVRPYGFADIWRMVARTAFTQLHHSPTRLLLTVAGMFLIYFVPVGGLIGGILAGSYSTAMPAFAAWALMVFAYTPTLRLYRQPGIAAWLLPIAAFLYTLMTLDSARRHWQGTGGMWKGRNRNG
jgi:hopene-associated glycosyltransferase HpnB